MSIFALVAFRGPFLSLCRNPKSLLYLTFFALCGVAFCQVTYLLAIQYSNAGTATVIQYTGPVMIVLYFCVRGRRLPHPREVVAVVCVIVGTFLIATHGNPSTLVLTPQALFWALVSAFAYAIYSLIPRPLMAHYGSVPVVAGALLIGGIVLSCVLQSWTFDTGLDAKGFAVLFIGLVFFGTVVGFTVYFQAVRVLRLSSAASSSNSVRLSKLVTNRILLLRLSAFCRRGRRLSACSIAFLDRARRGAGVLSIGNTDTSFPPAPLWADLQGKKR